MNLDPLGAIGARVADTDLRAVAGDHAVDELRDLLAVHGVLVWPDQDVDDDDLVTVLRRLGELTFTPGEVPVEGRPELNVVTNVGRSRPPRSVFHVDTTYVPDPPAYTALRAVEVPEQGGATEFADMRHALATLPDDLRRAVEGRSVTHADDATDGVAGAEHPLVRPHPRTGQPSLFLTTPARCAAVSGLAPGEGRALVDALYQHATDPAGVTAHAWSAGDVVVWDNAWLMHRADHADVVGHRTLHRGLVAGGAHRRP